MIIRIMNKESGEVKEIRCENIQHAFDVYHFDRTVYGYSKEDCLIELLDDDYNILYSGHKMVECENCGATVRRLDSTEHEEN